MLHTDAAQQRPGNLPASAPEASQQKPPRAQKQANPGLPASQRMNGQPGDTTAADQTAGTLDTSHTSLIHDGLSRRHNRCKPDGRKHGHTAHQPHPRQAQPATTVGSYAPCNYTHTAGTAQPKMRDSNTSAWPGLHDTIPSGKDTSKPALPPELSREQDKDSCRA